MSKICPKCSTAMELEEGGATLPKPTRPGSELFAETMHAAHPAGGFQLTVYHCPKCRLIELYSG